MLTEPPIATGSTARWSNRTRRSTTERVDAVLRILASAEREPSARELAEALGLSSTRSMSRVINAALDKELIEATTDSPYDPNRAYRLTPSGTAAAARIP